jgi:hypothetical protein
LDCRKKYLELVINLEKPLFKGPILVDAGTGRRKEIQQDFVVVIQHRNVLGIRFNVVSAQKHILENKDK